LIKQSQATKIPQCTSSACAISKLNIVLKVDKENKNYFVHSFNSHLMIHP